MFYLCNTCLYFMLLLLICLEKLEENSDSIYWFRNISIEKPSNMIHGFFERRGSMSQLQGIISRLKNLQEQSSGGEPSQRFFEVNGERKCQVTFQPKSKLLS